jgi:hypothetical protein
MGVEDTFDAVPTDDELRRLNMQNAAALPPMQLPPPSAAPVAVEPTGIELPPVGAPVQPLTGLREAAAGGPPATVAPPASAPAPIDPAALPPVDTATMDPFGGPKTVKTGKGGTTREYIEPTADTAKIQADRAALLEKEKAAVVEATAQAKRKAEAEASTAAIDLQTRKVQAAERALKEHDEQVKIDQAQARYNADQNEHRRLLRDFYNPKNGYWARLSTPQQIAGGLSLLLGAFGSGSDGRNVGAEKIGEAMDADTATRRQQITDQLKLIDMSKADVSTARSNLEHALNGLDLRHATALEATAAEGRARLKRMGVSDAEIAGNKELLALDNAALDKREAHDKLVSAKVRKESEWSSVTTSGAAGTGTGGKGGAGMASAREAAANLNDLESGIKEGLAHPVSVKEMAKYQDNKTRAEAAATAGAKDIKGSLITTGMRQLQLVPRSAYEGLSENAKSGIRASENLRAAQQKIITGLAAPVGEMNDIMGRFGVDPTDTQADRINKMRGFIQAIRNRAIQAGPYGQMYLDKADRLEAMIGGGGSRGSSVAPPGTVPATRGGRPPGPGAVRKVSPKYGPGWVFNGEFLPDNSNIKL